MRGIKLINIAPTCSLPVFNGADRRVIELNNGLKDSNIASTLLLGNCVVNADGTLEDLVEKPGLSKIPAALISFLFGKDYWQVRFCGRSVVRKLRLISTEVDIVYVNFLYCADMAIGVKPKDAILVVDTHNYDPEFYMGLLTKGANAVTRTLCARAAKLADTILRALPEGTVMIHVSENDRNLYSSIRPDLKHFVVENGATIKPRRVVPDYSSPIKNIAFVGSLSAKMNQDALVNFADKYWPFLQDLSKVVIIGSNPPLKIIKLCSQYGWELRSNVSEMELDRLYESIHYSILPFAYGAGSKLKLFEACGRLVPVLTSSHGISGLDKVPPLVKVSDDPLDWRETISKTGFFSESDVLLTSAFAEDLSWRKLTSKLMGFLSEQYNNR